MSETRPLSNDVLRRVSAAIEARLTPELNDAPAMALLVVTADVLRELDAALAREQQPPTLSEAEQIQANTLATLRRDAEWAKSQAPPPAQPASVEEATANYLRR